MDSHDAAYLAGIIDGEGSIGIYVARGGKGYGSHVLQVTIRMNEPAYVIHLISELLGVKTIPHPARGNSKPSRSVIVRAEKARLFLLEIHDYLLVKYDHATLGIAFQEAKTNWVRNNRKGWGVGRARMTEEEWNLRERYRIQMYLLNSGRSLAVAETEWKGTTKLRREATVRPPQECGEAGRNDQPRRAVGE